MIVFPAIDLIAGKVVRLERGERSHMNVYSSDPVGVAKDFAARGATWVHVVDLSSTLGEDESARAANDAAIRAICDSGVIRVDVGGGVRSFERLAQLICAGCERVSMGTALVRNPALAKRAARAYPEHVVADIAVREGQVRVNGWKDSTAVNADDLIRSLAEMGFAHLVLTDVSRDGMQTGIDVDFYRHAARVAGFPVVASGGIATLDDIGALAHAGTDVIEGAITGRAIYEGAFTLEDALAHAGNR